MKSIFQYDDKKDNVSYTSKLFSIVLKLSWLIDSNLYINSHVKNSHKSITYKIAFIINSVQKKKTI